jgi:SAM-dependent methyltransferase
MTLDTFERYKHNLYLSPISSGTLEQLGYRCHLTESSNVLDVSCGKGGAALALAEMFQCVVTGVEAREEFAEEARRRVVFGDFDLYVNIIDADPGALPFDDGYFDLAMMLGSTRPLDLGREIGEISRVVRRDGWLALSEFVWKPGAGGRAPGPVRDWLGGFCPEGIADIEGRIGQFTEAGFQVESAALEPDEAWESFYAPQARALLEMRRDSNGAAPERAALDQWQKELELFHSGGGKEVIGYACYLLRRP